MTTTLFVVIIILTWNIAVLYLPFKKRQKVKLSVISWAILIGFCLFNIGNEVNSEQEICNKIAWMQTFNPNSAKAMMAAYNVSEEELNSKAERPTPIEGIVFTLIAVALYTPLFLYAVVIDNDNDNDKKTAKGLQLIFALNVVASALLLSLYFGLQLALFPWIKKSERLKTLPISKKKIHLVA